MKHSDFVHLHLHTQFSLLDGAIRLPQLMERAQELKMPAIAMTDHGNLFGVASFYREAAATGIKPIVGCEVYVARSSRLDKGQGSTEIPYHLILLSRNMEGYKNLIKLVSDAYLNGFYYKPRIDFELLQRHSEGLIGLSSCLQGEIPSALRDGAWDRAVRAAVRYREILGEGNFYLEVQDHGLPDQREVNEALRRLGRELSIPMVATNDCHYIHREDSEAHDVLLCIQTGKILNDPRRMRLGSDQFYLKSSEEMKGIFSSFPCAIENTISVAERCNLSLSFDKVHLPRFVPPAGYTLDSYLEKLAGEGLEERLKAGKGADGTKERAYRERLEHELRIISQMGYSGYFLIVWDFIDYARKKGIPVGPGRGSAAGSLVAYSLKITDLDPMRYDLLFERFLNPERVTLPDIDVDFCQERRDEVIEYVTGRYGADNVAQIITFGTMMARGVIRDVGRVYGMPYGDVDRIAKLVPNRLNITLDEALESEPKLREMEEGDRDVRTLLSTARKLEGLIRHASTHAAGVVISPEPLTEFVPLYRGSNGEVVTQYAMEGIEALGLLKMDFLGLGTLTLIRKAIWLIREARGEAIEIENIALDDAATYRLLGEGRTLGVFQLESSGLRDLLKKLKPETFEDIIALVALYRPGPLGSGMVEDFIERRHGRVPIEYETPQLEGILRETYGVIVYQEQVMRIASTLAGFTLGEADLLRRAMGKKKMEVMLQQKEKFVQGAVKRGLTEEKAEKIFALMEYFAGYGFNKSHSAAYALVAYWTAYLKANYPVEFMAALLTSTRDNTDKVIRYMRECVDMGIEVLPPDVNESRCDFIVSEGKIRFGLGGIKNVGEGAVEIILKARGERGRFDTLGDMCQNVDLRLVNRRVLESLIKAGACDSFGHTRRSLLEVLDAVMEWSQKKHTERENGQVSLFGAENGLMDQPEPISGSEGEEWPEPQLLNLEKEVLGFYFSGHPLTRYEREMKLFADFNSSNLAEAPDGGEVKVAGIVHAVRRTTTRKGEPMAFVTLQDMHGIIDVVAFPEVYRTSLPLLDKEEPVVVQGKADAGEDGTKVIAERITSLGRAGSEMISRAHIDLSLADISRETLIRLREILASHRGDCRVLLHFHDGEDMDGGVTLAVDRGLRVDPSQRLAEDVRQLLGRGALRFE